MIRKNDQKQVEHKPAPFDGTGDITVRHLLKGSEEKYGKRRVIAHSTLPPGCAIGYHTHTNESETYYIYSGSGEFNDNGTVVPVSAGDVTFTGAGEGHGLANTGDVPLEFIALILYR